MTQPTQPQNEDDVKLVDEIVNCVNNYPTDHGMLLVLIGEVTNPLRSQIEALRKENERCYIKQGELTETIERMKDVESFYKEEKNNDRDRITDLERVVGECEGALNSSYARAGGNTLQKLENENRIKQALASIAALGLGKGSG